MSTAADNLFKRHRINVNEYYRMAEVGLLAPDARVELIEGEIIDMSPIGKEHFYVVNLLNRILNRAVGERGIVSVQQPVRLSESTQPEPDIAVLKPPTEKYLKGLPQGSDILLLVEVSDTTLAYDLKVKIPLYARHGISEVWIVDINSKQLHCFRESAGENYSMIRIVQNGSVAIAALPDIKIDISSVLKF